MRAEEFANVFDALADGPVEAANLTARAEFMLSIQRRVDAWSMPRDEAAAKLGFSRPRLNDLMRRKLHRFSLRALVNLATAAGYWLLIEMADAA